MWNAASTTAAWTQFSGDIGASLYTIVVALLVVIAGFLIIGWSLRKTKHHVTGRKF